MQTAPLTAQTHEEEEVVVVKNIELVVRVAQAMAELRRAKRSKESQGEAIEETHARDVARHEATHEARSAQHRPGMIAHLA